jgi:hypothetical protein
MSELGNVGTRIIYEDGAVRVWLLELAGNSASDWHTHECDYVYVVTQPGIVESEYLDGRCERQSDQKGTAVYSVDRLRHRLVNVSDHPYQNIVIELLGT